MADHRLLYGRSLRKAILDAACDKIATLSRGCQIGRLVSISIGRDDASRVYIRNQARAASLVGVPFESQEWPENLERDGYKERLVAMNDDPDILGVILQRPAPPHVNLRSLQSAIHPFKDVEGMNPASIGNIVYNDLALAPCTAAASVALLRSTGLQMQGLEVVMVGHSEIVGKPIAFMLLAEGATVTVCHHMTHSVAMHSRRADAVIVAVGKPKLIGADMIKPGAAVIDIGINHVVNEKGEADIVGDVDTEAVLDIAGWVTPVPGGVGPVTVAVLMQNAATAFEKQKAAGWI